MNSRLTYADYLEETEADIEDYYPCSCGRIVEPAGLFDVRHYDDDVLAGDWRCGTCVSHQDRIEQAAAQNCQPASWSENCEIGNQIRALRLTMIEQVRWLRERHADEVTLNLTPTLSEQEYTDLLTYIQALRDLSEDFETPDEVNWPEKPLFLA